MRPSGETKIFYTIKPSSVSSDLIPDYIFNKRLKQEFLAPPAVKDFLNDVNLCSHITGVTGLHKIMAEGIPLRYKILGGCQIIRLFNKNF